MTTAQRPRKQQKPAEILRQEAFIALARAETALRDGLDRLLAPRALSLTQYNVLRILRGAPQDGLCRNEIGERLITRMPDVTRLLDRMEAAGLVSRVRSAEDRRLVTTTLTAHGRALVDDLDAEGPRTAGPSWMISTPRLPGCTASSSGI